MSALAVALRLNLLQLHKQSPWLGPNLFMCCSIYALASSCGCYGASAIELHEFLRLILGMDFLDWVASHWSELLLNARLSPVFHFL